MRHTCWNNTAIFIPDSWNHTTAENPAQNTIYRT